MSYKKNDDGLDRMTVFQECISEFNASPINPRKSRTLLSRLLYIVTTGAPFPRDESTQLFFSITKLFQHKNPALRQMVYLAIKELADDADDVIMVTSSIMRDATGNDVFYRSNAIRTLCRIIDASTIQSIERLIKASIVDKNPATSSAALVGSYHLLPVSRDFVRRWANETQDTVVANKPYPAALLIGRENTSSFGYGSGIAAFQTQFHALGLLYEMRSHDRVALLKIIQQFNGKLHSPYANILLIRFASRVLAEDPNVRKPMHKLILSFLNHANDAVSLESARAILAIRNATPQEVEPAISSLQLLLGSHRPAFRFAAIRALNRYAMSHPEAVQICNPDIQERISDPSRTVATYAITTLLKTGNNDSVDHLMSQISNFMLDIPDEFKVVVVEAVRSLAVKFPSKQQDVLHFLADILQSDGGVSFKQAVVSAIFDLVRFVPQAKAEALSQLCEYIEDCEYPFLAARILHFLGVEGPSTEDPLKYVRYIYNRILLENAVTRAAAVTALGKFLLVDKTGSVKTLLERTLDDSSDEVRDRAAIILRIATIPNKKIVADFIEPEQNYSLGALEQELVRYVTASDFEKPFDFSVVPTFTKEQENAEMLQAMQKATKSVDEDITQGASAAEKEQETASAISEKLAAIEEIRELGRVLHTSSAVELTERETEYVVTGYKHIFEKHIVLQYDVSNTLPDTILADVTAMVTPSEELNEEFVVALPELKPNSEGTIYVAFERPEDLFVSFETVLKFESKEIDPSTGEVGEGYLDQYEIESLELSVGDYLIPAFNGNFDHTWDELGNEASATYALEVPTIEDGVQALLKLLSIQAIGGTDHVTEPASHTLKGFARTLEGGSIAVVARFVHSAARGVSVKLVARGEDEMLTQLVCEVFE
ncbi:hypothetical protein CANCADRAFT_97844 [Tortispora caseinolytica NRRL Y-17796]|uniref:Coatomer subunit gamma n=1 Tax=Tortispora caseinolytica NRRL Y-17796 TaxID=767744 RepID=A0A1E4TDY5_9ASCO|nr:hypothetical protein CANCADRAFT_97844 [Tortispora caseinolytica NRRL Y-17796]